MIPPEENWQEEFGTRSQQELAAQLGMWIFLGTELLLFGGMFIGFGYYRFVYGETFRAASEHLHTDVALIQTLMLLTSSFLVTLSIYSIKKDRQLLAAGLLVVAILLGIGFTAIKFWEWYTHWQEGLLPGEWYHSEELQLHGASLFFTLYWLLTSAHVIHLTVGAGLLSFVAFRLAAGAYNADYHVEVEICGMYWHFVDVIWTLIFTLLYLAS